MNVRIGDRVRFAKNISKSGGVYSELACLLNKTAVITKVDWHGAVDLKWDDGSERLTYWLAWPFGPGELFEPFIETNEWEDELELL